MYRRDAFAQYFLNVIGGKEGTLPTYRSYLKRIDELAGDLDGKIEKEGVEAVRAWGKTQSSEPFETYGSSARSILNAYLDFASEGADAATLDEVSTAGEEASGASGTLFKIEREMQAAIRSDLGSLEAGLSAIDGGVEVSTATGRIDILARDASGTLTAIELKAGNCPAGAIEQVLGYAQALADEKAEETRAILIASSFTDRQRAAAKRAKGLVLRTYTYRLNYCDVS